MRLLTAAGLVVFSSCSSPPATRSVEGRLTGTTGQALVLSESQTGAQTSGAVAPDGTFKLQVPTDEPVTLLVAVRNGTTFDVVRHIGPAWFTLKQGATLDLGVVRPQGATAVALEPSTQAPVHTCVSSPGQAELPYDAKLSLGQSWQLSQAFAEKGPLPARVISVTMDGSSWRLTELQNNTLFTVGQADCDHSGNRDVGRDRAVITWQNADGSTASDHLDLRYCESGSSTQGLDDADHTADSNTPSGGDDLECAEVEHQGCGSEGSDCDHEDELVPVSGSACPGAPSTTPPATTPPPTPGPQ